jgi:murein DD-endopeptidase MepM/ murein hydrolase activator NlpD
MKRQERWCVLILVALAACSTDATAPPGPDDPAWITFEEATVDLFVTETYALRPLVTNAAGAPVEATVKWTSSDASVAVVAVDGRVTGAGAGMAEIRAEVGAVSATVAVRVTPALDLLVPIEGQVGVDYYLNHYVAHDGPEGDPVDFQCGRKAPAGHAGTDFALSDLEAMRGEVAVRAAGRGTVTEVHDGEPNFSIHIDPDAPPNRVVIDHGDGLRTVYENLWDQMIQVKEGDAVEAGEPLGSVGSSGGSWIPHLHFEVRLHERVIDPYSGPCASSVDQWAVPMAYEDRFEVLRARVSDYQLQTAPHFAVDVPASADTIFAGRNFVAWIQELNAQLLSRSRIRILDSNGLVRREAHQIRFAGPQGLTWFGVRLSTVNETIGGTWTMEYLYEDVLMRTESFEMVVR